MPHTTMCGSILQQKRVASLRTRTVSTVTMIAGFLVIIYMGHVPLVFLVLTLQVSISWPEHAAAMSRQLVWP